MAKKTLLMQQYQSEYLLAFKSIDNKDKPFEKAFMDDMKFFMAILGRINFFKLGRYGDFSEQTYFSKETFITFMYESNFHVISCFRNILFDIGK